MVSDEIMIQEKNVDRKMVTRRRGMRRVGARWRMRMSQDGAVDITILQGRIQDY